MGFWVFMRYGLCLLVGLLSFPAFASDEARRLTEELRKYDRYARVFTSEQWDKLHDPNPSNVISHLLPGDSAVGYIKIANFDSSTTCRDVRLALVKLKELGAKSLRLDLRGNPGGQRMMGVCVAGLFVGSGPIMGLVNMPSLLPNLSDLVEEPYDSSDTEVIWLPSETDQQTDLAVSVLIDNRTGSSAEIVAGAIQDYGRGTVVGERSFGKGSSTDCSAMKNRPDLVLCYTIQRYLLPSGRCPEGTGITPSISGRLEP